MSFVPDPRCAFDRVADFTGFHFHRCDNRAKYGKFCGVHCPERQAERRKRRPTQFERELAARDVRLEKRARYNRALDEVLRLARVDPTDQMRAALEKFDTMSKEFTS